MLIKLAIWYLRKRKCSVLMNYKIEHAKLTQLQKNGNIFDCQIEGGEHYLPSGERWDVPNGKFKFKRRVIE